MPTMGTAMPSPSAKGWRCRPASSSICCPRVRSPEQYGLVHPELGTRHAGRKFPPRGRQSLAPADLQPGSAEYSVETTGPGGETVTAPPPPHLLRRHPTGAQSQPAACGRHSCPANGRASLPRIVPHSLPASRCPANIRQARFPRGSSAKRPAGQESLANLLKQFRS